MSGIICICLIVAAKEQLLVYTHHAKLRVMYGVNDTEGKYPYAVALLAIQCIRTGTGALISPQWVLTAAHCLIPSVTHIQYGDMTIMPLLSPTVTLILEKIQNPGSRSGIIVSNDIGLCRIEFVMVKNFAKISAVDYNSLLGKPVKYAGYGITHYSNKFTDLFTRPLQIGEGVVISCKDFVDNSWGPNICIAPKCTNKQADSAIGDSGGPLFYDEKIVGVVSWGDDLTPIGRYAAVSPFLPWILDVISSKDGQRKRS